MTRPLLGALFLAPAFALALAAPSPAWAGTGASSAGEGEFWGRGRLDARYGFRSTGESDPDERSTDQDLTQDLFVEGGYGKRFRAEASGRLHEDIDGRPEVSVFRDLYDTYGDAVVGFLYTAYVEAIDLGPLSRIRAGRQYLAESVDIRFDGALFEAPAPFMPEVLRFSAYGGVPVNLYEASPQGDWLAGASAEASLGTRATVRLDYTHVTDERDDARRTNARYGTTYRTVRDDDLFQLSFTHRLTRDVRLAGRVSTFEGRSTRFEADALYQDGEGDFSMRARYVAQLGSYRSLSFAFTPYDEQMGAYAPYHEVFLDARKGLAEGISLAGGGALRVLQDGSDEGAFNHGFARLFWRLDLTGIPWEGFSVGPLAEWYYRWSDEWTAQGSIDVSQRLGAWRVGGGTAYALYRFDEFFLEEREDVRTYYGSVEWSPITALRVRVAYDFQTDDVDHFHVVRFEVRYEF